jgi:hypothetical protein
MDKKKITGFNQLAVDLAKSTPDLNDDPDNNIKWFAAFRRAFKLGYSDHVDWNKSASRKPWLPLLNEVIRKKVLPGTAVALIVTQYDDVDDEKIDLEKIILSLPGPTNQDAAARAYAQFKSFTMDSAEILDPIAFLLKAHLLASKATVEYVPILALIRHCYDGLNSWWRHTPGVLPKFGSASLRADSWENFYEDMTLLVAQNNEAWQKVRTSLLPPPAPEAHSPCDGQPIKTV